MPSHDRILVPLSNPRSERALVELAASVAHADGGGTMHAIHVVAVPDQTPLAVARERFPTESTPLLAVAREHARSVGPDIAVETTSIASHRPFDTIYGYARSTDADLVVMGWGEREAWSTGSADRPIRDFGRTIPADFLALKDRGFDADRVLLPTAGGPDSDLSAELVAALRASGEIEVTLLHVVDADRDRPDADAFLAEWANEHGLDDAEHRIETHGDVDRAIREHAADRTLVVIGAPGRGLVGRLLTGTVHSRIVEAVDCSVVLAERAPDRSVLSRVFGWR